MKQEQQSSDDMRVRATTRIWSMAVGMMGISIPLSAITHTALIPLAVIAGAAVGTCGVWFFGNKNSSSSVGKTEVAAQQRIAELEERLANLETINNFERRLAEESLKRDEEFLSGKVMPDVQREMETATPQPIIIKSHG